MSSGGAAEITGALPMADARYVKAKTCVWWDIENCAVPRSCDPYSIAQNISKSLADMNYKGVVTISAYGDTTKINSSVQQALSSTGIALNHVPAGIKDASDKKILVDMLIWGYDNPPPANHLLISGDRDFSNALHQLSMRRYNILLAQPEKASQALVSAAKTVWLWTSLVGGGRPFEKLSNFHNTSTNSKSNFMTESNSIACPSQPDDFDLKNNNNGNFYNGNKANKISNTQSQPVISASSSKGNEDVYKQSIGSSDFSNPNQENDLKHPNSMFVSTTAELGSDCNRSNSNSNIMAESSRILYSSQPDDINPKNNDNREFDKHKKEEQISRTQSQPVIITSLSNGNEEGNKQSIGNSDQRNELKQPILSTQPEKVSHALASAAKTVWQWTSLVVGGRPEEKIPNLHDTLANSISNNKMQGSSISYSSQPDDLNQKSSNNGNFDNHSKAKQISKSQSQPIMISSSSNGNEEGSKLPIGSSDSSKLNQMDDSKTTDLGSNHISSSSNGNEEGNTLPIGSLGSSNFNQKNDLKLPSHAFVLTDPDLDSKRITSNTNPTPCIPQSQQLVDSGKFNAPSRLNCKTKIKQKVGNISNTSSAYSTKSSSSVTPESNPTNASKINAKVKIAIKKSSKKNHKQQQNQCSQSCFQSRNLSGSNCNHNSSSSTVPTIRPNNYQDVLSAMPNVSPSAPIHVQMGFILEALNILKSEKISPTEANILECIRYGNISVQNFYVKMSLDCAVEHQVVVMHKFGNCMPLYVGRNDTLWNCVNIMDRNAVHGTEIFYAVLKFLTSANGQSAILSSQCRYQAALILRESCLKDIVLGEILQLLHIIIQFRKWIVPHASGWQPLTVTVFINSDEVSTSSPSTAFGWR